VPDQHLNVAHYLRSKVATLHASMVKDVEAARKKKGPYGGDQATFNFTYTDLHGYEHKINVVVYDLTDKNLVSPPQSMAFVHPDFDQY
jgi:hypothetical protein